MKKTKTATMINERYLFFKIIIKKEFESEANLDFLISIAGARQNKKKKNYLYVINILRDITSIIKKNQ